MRLFIIAAMHEEMAGIIEDKRFSFKPSPYSVFEFYEGKVNNYDIILGVCGIGRTHAAMLIEAMYAKYSIKEDDTFINIGCAGAIAPFHKHEVAVCNSFVYGDVDIRLIGPYRYGQMSKSPFEYKFDTPIYDKLCEQINSPKGLTVQSNERFVTELEYINNQLKEYYSDLNIRLFDMEGAAFGQAIAKHGAKLVSIKYVSDVVGDEGQDADYMNNAELDGRSSHEVLRDIVAEFLLSL